MAYRVAQLKVKARTDDTNVRPHLTLDKYRDRPIRRGVGSMYDEFGPLFWLGSETTYCQLPSHWSMGPTDQVTDLQIFSIEENHHFNPDQCIIKAPIYLTHPFLNAVFVNIISAYVWLKYWGEHSRLWKYEILICFVHSLLLILQNKVSLYFCMPSSENTWCKVIINVSIWCRYIVVLI